MCRFLKSLLAEQFATRLTRWIGRHREPGCRTSVSSRGRVAFSQGQVQCYATTFWKRSHHHGWQDRRGERENSSSWTGRSTSRVGSASPTSGWGTPKTPTTGATRISRWKDRSSPSAKRPSWTTDSRRRAESCQEVRFPEVAPAGSHRAQVVMSSPAEGSERQG